MAIALVTSAKVSGSNGGTTGAVTTTGASLLVAFSSENASPGVTPSDSKTNTWVPLTALTATTPDGTMFYVANPTVGTGHTFTAGGSSTFCTFMVAAFSGVATASPFDQQNGNVGSGFTAGLANAFPGSITPTQNDELIVCCFAHDGAADMAIDSGMTIIDQTALVGGTSFAGAMAYKVQTTAAAINPIWGGFAGVRAGSIPIASFKAGAAAVTSLLAARRRHPNARGLITHPRRYR